MPDDRTTHRLAFVTTALVLTRTPGPSIAFTLGHTPRPGRRHRIAPLFRTRTALFCHMAFAVSGRTAILATSALAFPNVKPAGVAYLS